MLSKETPTIRNVIKTQTKLFTKSIEEIEINLQSCDKMGDSYWSQKNYSYPITCLKILNHLKKFIPINIKINLNLNLSRTKIDLMRSDMGDKF